MLPPAPLWERVAWALLLFLVAGFMLGTWLNRKRGRALGEWVDAGIKRMGGQTTWKFIRSLSSGAQVTVVGANEPYRSVEAGYYLLTRELPPLLAIELLRGKRDLFSLKADLRAVPAIEYDVVPLDGALRRELDVAAAGDPYAWVELPAGLGLATRHREPAKVAARLRPFLERYGEGVQRLSLRARRPNVVLFMHFEGMEDQPPREMFDALRRLV